MSLIPKFLTAAALIVALATSASAASETKGTVQGVFPDQHIFILMDDEAGTWTFYLDGKSKVLIAERAAKLADLLPGDYVRVFYEDRRDRLMATEIRCRRDAVIITDPSPRR